MKKMILGLMAVMAVFVFTACTDFNLTDEQKAQVKTELGLVDGTNGLDGINGINGIDGMSAYEIWLFIGNEGSEEDFIASLQGPNGESAYDIAVENGFEGTEEEWLESLHGEDGIDGEDGEDGTDGVCSTCDDNETVPPVDDNTTIPEGVVLMTFATTEGITDVKIGHLLDGVLISIEDAVGVDDNGTLYIEGNVSLENNGTHMIGIQFER